MLEEAEILELVYKAPFPKVVADTLMFIVRKHAGPHNGMVLISEYGRDAIEIQQNAILKDPAHRFQYFESTKIMELVSKIDSLKAKTPIKDLCQSTSGFGGKSHLIQEKQSNNRQIPTLKGDSIGRYCVRKQYWFEFKKQNITGRTTDIDKLGASPKILLRKTGDRIIATYDESRVFPEQSLYFLYNPKP